MSSSGINTFNTNYLLPGYSIQAGCFLRSKAYEGADWVQQRHKTMGALASHFVYPLSKTSEYIELPFRIVEDVALSVINGVGAIFNKGCRKNLQHCGWRLLGDFGNTVFTVAVFSNMISMIFFIEIHILRFIADPCLNNAKEQADHHLISFYRLKAMREHGYENIRKIEEKVSFLNKKQNDIAVTSDLLTKDSSKILTIYKSLAETSSEGFDEWYQSYNDQVELVAPKKEKEIESLECRDWERPTDLEKSAASPDIEQILNYSENVDFTQLNKPTARLIFCQMLKVPVGRKDALIRESHQFCVLALNVDPNEERAKEAIDALNKAYLAAGLRVVEKDEASEDMAEDPTGSDSD